MTRYYVNKAAQSESGDHEVHREDCRYLPSPENRSYLGDFATCQPAVAEAKKQYSTADGCAICSPACHTS